MVKLVFRNFVFFFLFSIFSPCALVWADELTIWLMVKDEKILEAVEEFIDSHEGINVKVQFIGWDNALQKIEHEAIAEGVDVVQIGSTWTAFLADKGKLEDISMFMKLKESDFIPPSLKSAKIMGKDVYYAMPWSLDVRFFIYNKRLFKEAGIDPKNLKNLTDFQNTCEQFKHQYQGSHKWFIGLPTSADDYSVLHTAMTWVWGWGGNIINAQGKVKILDGKAEEGMMHYTNLFMGGCSPSYNSENGKALKVDHIKKAFLEKEQYAVMFSGPWIFDDIGKLDDPKNFVPLGAIPGEDHSSPNIFLGGSHLALIHSKRTPLEEKAAFEFLSFLSLKGNFGVGLAPQVSYLKGLLLDPQRSFIPEMLFHADASYPSISIWGRVEEIMNARIANIIKRTMPLNETQDVEMRAIIHEELSAAQGSIKGLDSMEYYRSEIIIVVGVGIGFLFMAITFYLIKKKNKIGVADAIGRFDQIRNLLHRANTYKGEITNPDKMVQVRARLSPRIDEVLKEIKNLLRGIDIKEASMLAVLVQALKDGKPDVDQYKAIISQKGYTPGGYESALISFFEEKIRSMINRMSDTLEECYVDQKRFEEIICSLKAKFKFNHSFLDGYKTMVIVPSDLTSSLENILGNAQHAVIGATNPLIEMIISTLLTDIQLTIQDNGSGMPSAVRMGQGIKDVTRCMGKWHGELIIRNRPVKGTEAILTIKRFF